MYGHMNNTVYYALIDSAVNRYLLDRGALQLPTAPAQAPAAAAATTAATGAASPPPPAAPAIGVVVSSGCSFFYSLAYPGSVDVGVRVARVGTSSVVYEAGLFAAGAAAPAAQGHFTHVYVDAVTRRPVAALPARLAAVVRALEEVR